MTQILRQSSAVDVLIGPFLDLTDGATSETGESPVVKLSKNGQALAAKSDVTTPVHDADGYYNCELDATDTNTVGTLILTVAKSATALPVRHEFMVIEEALYDAIYASGAAVIPANVTQYGGVAGTFSGGRPEVNTTHAAGTAWASGAITAASIATGAIDADAIADNAIDAGAIATGALTAAKFAAGAIDAAALAADAGTEIATAVWASGTRVLTANTNLNDPTAAAIADAVWDEDATGHQTGGTFGQAIGDPGADTTTIYQSVVTDAAGTNVAADIIAIKAETASILTDTAEIGAAGAGLTAINLPDQTMNITGNITGNLSGSVGSVTGAVGSVTGNVGGNVTGSVGGVATGGITAASFGASAIDAAALAADAGTEIGTAVWASAARTLTAIDEDSTTLDLDATVRAVVGLAAADLDTQLGALPTAAENATAVLTTQMTESYAANGTAPTLAQGVFAVHQMLMQHAISGTTWTAYKLDNVTVAFAVTLNDATTPTSARRT